MSSFLTKSFFVLLAMTLVLISDKHFVQAQSTESTDTSPQANPSNTQPSSPLEITSPPPLRNYIGIGGNIGVSGNRTGLSQGGAALITKNDLNDSLSIRSVSVFGNNRTDNTLALTFNFPVTSNQRKMQFVPFVGGGLLLSSKYNFNDFIVRGLVTGGIDVPWSQRFTANTSINVGFTDKTSIGIQLGIAYNF